MGKLRIICEENDSQFRVTDYKKPFRTDESSLFIAGCREELLKMGLSGELISQPSTNESSIFSRTGIDCLCFGPGKREGNAHTPSENVVIADLHKAIEFYRKVIERFCL
jgi:succinyl-diaminopimelate desuccinylase